MIKLPLTQGKIALIDDCDAAQARYVRFNKKRKHLGNFTDKIEAAKAYDVAAIKLFGYFARLNFSQPQTRT